MKAYNFRIVLLFLYLYPLLILPLIGTCYAQDNVDPNIKWIENKLSEFENKLSEFEKNKASRDEMSGFKENAQNIIKLSSQKADMAWNTIFFMTGASALLIAVLTFIGLKPYLFSFRRNIKETMHLFEEMEKSFKEKEEELNDKYGDIVGYEKEGYSHMDKAKFLDYEHKLYFARLCLPINKNIMKHKKSLFVLGIYWFDQKHYSRALLRFREIESLHNKFGYRDEIILQDAYKFYNFYGIICVNCARDANTDSEKNNLLLEAERHYRKAISINKHYSSPYYNLARLLSCDRNSDVYYEEALKLNEEALKKTPPISYEIYRNMACCMIKMKKPTDEVIKVLKNISPNDVYWKEVIKDSCIYLKMYEDNNLKKFIKSHISSNKEVILYFDKLLTDTNNTNVFL